jgi:integrase/recombinase XerD
MASTSETETVIDPQTDTLFEDFIATRKPQWKESTKVTRQEFLRPYLRWTTEQDIDVTEVDTRTLRTYLNHLQDSGQSGHTLSNAYTSLKMFYSYLEEERGLIDESPAEDIDIRSFESVKAVKHGSKRANELRSKGGFVSITRDEVEQLIEHADEPRGNPLRNELVIKMLFQTGVRRGELREIKLRDMDRDANPPSIEVPTLKVDGNPIRIVYYEPSLNTDLNLWIDGGYRDALPTAKDSPYLFPSDKSEQLGEWVINRIVVDAAEAAGLQESSYTDYNGRSRNSITAHTLRHSFAMECLRSDIDVKTIQSVMGHQKLETTQRYLDAYEETTRRKMRRFGTRRDE